MTSGTLGASVTFCLAGGLRAPYNLPPRDMKKPSLLVIFLTVFIDLVGFGIVLPLLPKYAERFGAHGFKIGLIISSFSLMQFFFAPLWGRLSDRIGRRPVLLVSTAGSAISYALFALASVVEGQIGPWHAGLWVLLGSRSFAGICGANLAVASAYIADITAHENRSKGMGLIGMAFGLGFILGPALGGVSDACFGLTGPGWVASALCAANFGLCCVILPESRRADSECAARRPRLAEWLHAFRHPKLGRLIVVFALATFCFTSYESTLTLLLGSSSLHTDDLKDLPALTSRVRAGADPVSRHVQALLPERLRREPTSPDEAQRLSSSQRKAWLHELNRLLESPAFYDEAAFAGVGLRPATRALRDHKLHDEHLAYFNRLLFEDAFPECVVPLRRYYDATHIGYLFAFCGLVAAAVQGGAIGRLVRKFGEPRLIWISLLVVGLGFALTPHVYGLAAILMALGLFSAGSGINRAPTMGMISMLAPRAEQGSIMGVAQSAGALARIAGPVLGTTLFAMHRPLPYLLCALVAAVTSFLAWRTLGNIPRDQPAD